MLDRVGSRLDDLAEQLLFVSTEPAQHPLRRVETSRCGRDTELEAPEVSADPADGVLHPALTASAAPVAETQATQRQVHVVMHDQQLRGLHAVTAQARLDCGA